MEKRDELTEDLRNMLADVCYPDVDSGAMVFAIEQLIIYHIEATRDSRYPIKRISDAQKYSACTGELMPPDEVK